jgi:hypothetical protein
MNCTITSGEIATTTQECDRYIVLLDAALIKFLRLGSLCKVQQNRKELELDANQVLVPKDWKMIKLRVKDDSRQLGR